MKFYPCISVLKFNYVPYPSHLKVSMYPRLKTIPMYYLYQF
jgi:hypothetical protein